MELTFKSVPGAENIRSWADAMPGKLYIGYNRMCFNRGWQPRWFTDKGDTHWFGEICLGLTKQEVDFLNSVTNILKTKWENGCDKKMIRDLTQMNCKVGKHLYLLEVEGGPCGCLIHFNTTYGNGDYPVRVYLYREGSKVE